MILVLFTPQGSEQIVGTFSNVLFSCDDMQATFEEPSARGVEFVDKPREESWRLWASFKDPRRQHLRSGPEGQLRDRDRARAMPGERTAA